MQPTTFEQEYASTQAAIKGYFVAEAGEYRFKKEDLETLCHSLFLAGRTSGMDYALNKIQGI